MGTEWEHCATEHVRVAVLRRRAVPIPLLEPGLLALLRVGAVPLARTPDAEE